MTLGFVKNRLLDEEAKRSGSSVKGTQNKSRSSVALVIKTKRGKAGENKKSESNQFRFKCYNCGLFGHKRADYKKKSKENKNSDVANVAELSRH